MLRQIMEDQQKVCHDQLVMSSRVMGRRIGHIQSIGHTCNQFAILDFWPLILGSDLTPQRFKSSHILFFMTCFSLQIITFRDYLPIVLGSELQKWIPPYQGYNNSVDPRISNVFTFAFRFGHLEVPSTVSRLDENYQPWGPEAELPLHTLFFNTWRIIKDGMSFRGHSITWLSHSAACF